MAEIINFNNITEEEVRNIEGGAAASENESQPINPFQLIGALIDETHDNSNNPEEPSGLELITAMLMLPDEQFDTIKDVLIQSFEQTSSSKQYHNFAEALVNNSNIQVSDIEDGFEEIIEHFKTEGLSENKIDFLTQIANLFINVVIQIKKINVLNLPFELCHPDAKLPTYANEGDSGMDVYAIDDYVIKPGQEIKVPTGLKCAIPYGYELQVRPKSGRAYKTRLRIANTPGTIDAGYRDEICVLIENIDPPIKDVTYYFNDKHFPVLTSIEHGSNYYINKGEKFAQLVLMEVPKAFPYVVEKVVDFEGNRGGGFGSSGLT